ncbi:uncharacterized protein LOC113232715 [Hyposmocoma kahamanoa]|uniref:uncharacterized protein LOC113232715 n=1 Tax=Hyposmocoma kahamanoa TaxID=1477025 RepID=UPI000E6D9BEC|nr:uncharacterized protein LOC113232715 [Hyposmocoma kahamanoa]
MSEPIVLSQSRPPSVLDEQPPPYNPDVLSHVMEASENPEDTEEEKRQCLKEEARRNINQAEDCCCDCKDDNTADCCWLCLRCLCNPWGLFCRALAECCCCETSVYHLLGKGQLLY